MSEAKKRTIEEIQSEYTNLCVRAGNLQYQIEVYKSDLKLLNEQLKDLNLEAAKIKAEEKSE